METQKTIKIYLITGSIRDTKTRIIVAHALNKMLAKRSDITTEIVALEDYALPFYTNAIAPADRKTPITNPVLKRWSEKIKAADGYILVSPVYNAGYTPALKNALDSLYTEWNHKPVGFVGYSGGATGGSGMIEQLRTVTKVGLSMVPVATAITIPFSWKAFDKDNNLVDAQAIEKNLHTMVDEIIAAHAANVKAS